MSPWSRAASGANCLAPTSPQVMPTIYERTTASARHFEAVNLGQGYPDGDGPQWLLDEAAQTVADPSMGPSQQYPPGMGIPALREAIATLMSRRQHVHLDPATDVMVTAGATEALAAAILTYATAGSDVVCFSPHYDSYGAMTALAGAHLIGVPLAGQDFRPDLQALRDAVTERTSLIILNTPHNPSGTVFTAEELRSVVEIATEFNIPVISDEVYEHLVFHGSYPAEHCSILTVPGAAESAVAIGSAGKSFSVTGWKIGWITGGAQLVNQIRGVKQFLTFSSAPAFQWAVASGLADDRGYFDENAARLSSARDQLHAGLEELGFAPNNPQAGYFLLGRIDGLTDTDDVTFCQRLMEDAGVAAIPVSAFTRPEDAASPRTGGPAFNQLVRFAFCKYPETIHNALERMHQYLPRVLDRCEPSP